MAGNLRPEFLNQTRLKEDIITGNNHQAKVSKTFKEVRCEELKAVKMAFTKKALLGDGVQVRAYQIKRFLRCNTNLTLKQRHYPISSSNALNILIRQGTNGITKAMNYILEGVKYFVFKAACA